MLRVGSNSPTSHSSSPLDGPSVEKWEREKLPSKTCISCVLQREGQEAKVPELFHFEFKDEEETDSKTEHLFQELNVKVLY